MIRLAQDVSCNELCVLQCKIDVAANRLYQGSSEPLAEMGSWNRATTFRGRIIYLTVIRIVVN